MVPNHNLVDFVGNLIRHLQEEDDSLWVTRDFEWVSPLEVEVEFGPPKKIVHDLEVQCTEEGDFFYVRTKIQEGVYEDYRDAVSDILTILECPDIGTRRLRYLKSRYGRGVAGE